MSAMASETPFPICNSMLMSHAYTAHITNHRQYEEVAYFDEQKKRQEKQKYSSQNTKTYSPKLL